MLHSVFFFLTLAVSSPAPAASPVCEAHTNDVTGITHTVCDGSVVRTCDSLGTCHGPATAY